MKTLSEAELAAIRDRDHILVEAFRGRLTIIEADRHSLIAHIDTLNARIAELEKERDFALSTTSIMERRAEEAEERTRAETATAILRALIAECDIDDNGHTCVPTGEIERICKEHGAE